MHPNHSYLVILVPDSLSQRADTWSFERRVVASTAAPAQPMVQLHEQLPHSQIGTTPAAVVQHRCIVIAVFVAIVTACSLYQTPPVSLSSYLVITSKATSRDRQLVLRLQVSKREPGDC